MDNTSRHCEICAFYRDRTCIYENRNMTVCPGGLCGNFRLNEDGKIYRLNEEIERLRKENEQCKKKLSDLSNIIDRFIQHDSLPNSPQIWECSKRFMDCDNSPHCRCDTDGRKKCWNDFLKKIQNVSSNMHLVEHERG